MKTVIELNTDIAKNFLNNKHYKLAIINELPFNSINIQFPYEVFQSVEDIYANACKELGNRVSARNKRALLEKCKQISKVMVNIDFKMEKSHVYIDMTFMGSTALREKFIIMSGSLIPIPNVEVCTLHSEPRIFGMQILNLALNTFNFFNQPKIIKTRKSEKVDKVTGRKSYSTNKKTYVYNVRYTMDNVGDYLPKRTYQVHTEVWEQRGHYRTYKDGRKVWVKPCIKRRANSNSENPAPRTYKITRMQDNLA